MLNRVKTARNKVRNRVRFTLSIVLIAMCGNAGISAEIHIRTGADWPLMAITNSLMLENVGSSFALCEAAL
jgi:hypothetical protein